MNDQHAAMRGVILLKTSLGRLRPGLGLSAAGDRHRHAAYAGSVDLNQAVVCCETARAMPLADESWSGLPAAHALPWRKLRLAPQAAIRLGPGESQ
jgi:hypothetical protein